MTGPRFLFGAMLGLALGVAGFIPTVTSAQTNVAPRPGEARIDSIEGRPVEVTRAGSQAWDPASKEAPYNILRPGDQLRTGLGCRALVRLSDLTVIRVGPGSFLQMPPLQKKRSFSLLQGVLYFFHRDRPGEYDVQTPTVSAVIRGTEFNLTVEADGTTTLTMYDGEVDLENPQGQLNLKSGQGAIVRPGARPELRPVLEGESIIQWLLYYPGVLDVDELELTPEEEKTWAPSLGAYRAGDLLAARTNYFALAPADPAQRAQASDRLKVYESALELTVGRVAEALAVTKALRDEAVAQGENASRPARLSQALADVIAAVKRTPEAAPGPGPRETGRKRAVQMAGAGRVLASEQMARSLERQAQFDLPGALVAARNAAEKSPRFGFAHARVAELEFGSGRIRPSRAAAARALELSPRNAQAIALDGFLLAEQHRIRDALRRFDDALAVDGGLPTAWAGRGLTRIRLGREAEGREDLQTAALLEPHVSIWRSYLAKAFSNSRDNARARRELALARERDPRDPTSYLYSALLNQQENRINDAVRDLEKSLELNEARKLYRDQRLLDQDRAVRSANLATIYRDAGMPEVSVREAMRTLNADYANYGGHLFLGSSYNELRGAGRVDVRYETPALAEYLLANLQSGASAGTLSPNVTQQEYSKLFERDRFGFASDTEYLSRGAWQQTASQYGNWGGSAYSLDLFYRSDPGQRPNNDIEQIAPSISLKHEFSAQDTVFFQAQYAYTDSGDLRQVYDNDVDGDPNVRVRESLEPLLLLGYHREWSPFSHTYALGGFFRDRLSLADTDAAVRLFFTDTNGAEALAIPLAMVDPRLADFPASALNYRSLFEAGSAELQHVLKFSENSVVAGVRFQGGQFTTEGDLGASSAAPLINRNGSVLPPLSTGGTNVPAPGYRNDFQRVAVYGYYNWRVVDPLLLTAGVSYDNLYYPENFRFVPLNDEQQRKDQVSPKAGLIWTPHRNTAVRGSYTRSLGGVSFDQSIRLEPTQVGGFNQAYRSFTPESVVGSLAGARFENAGVALDQRFQTGTYVGLQAEWLHSKADRALGTMRIIPPTDPFGGGSLQDLSGSTTEKLNYYEKNFFASVNQLVGRDFSVGVRYRLSEATLDSRLPQVPISGALVNYTRESLLHQVNLFALFNHPSGIFAGCDALWSKQSNDAEVAGQPGNTFWDQAGDDFWQFNAHIGYRFPRRQAEITLALLNLTDQDYRLSPLNLVSDLPRSRTLAVRFRLNF